MSAHDLIISTDTTRWQRALESRGIVAELGPVSEGGRTIVVAFSKAGLDDLLGGATPDDLTKLASIFDG